MVSLIQFIGACVLLLLSSCSVHVAPWERGYLAKTHMSFQTDRLGDSVRQHTQQSKEGASGGHGVGGGGCGCG